jgi:hypothetical protein
MAVEALGLSPTSLKTTGPPATMRPPVKLVRLMASTTASGSTDLARSSTSAMTRMASYE